MADPGEFLFSVFRGSPERMLPPWEHLALSDRSEFARAEAACIAKGRAEAEEELRRVFTISHVIAERNDARKQLAALQAAAPRWIPTSERLPEVDEEVMFVARGDGHHVGVRGLDGDWFTGGRRWLAADVTHWMPLPPLPSEET